MDGVRPAADILSSIMEPVSQYLDERWREELYGD